MYRIGFNIGLRVLFNLSLKSGRVRLNVSMFLVLTSDYHKMTRDKTTWKNLIVVIMEEKEEEHAKQK